MELVSAYRRNLFDFLLNEDYQIALVNEDVYVGYVSDVNIHGVSLDIVDIMHNESSGLETNISSVKSCSIPLANISEYSLWS